MATDRTEALLIVVLASLQQTAEDAAVAADPAGGAGTFVPGTPLRAEGDQSNTVAAYWARWQMSPGQRSVFAQHLGGPILSVGQQPNRKRDAWMFDANPGQWTPEAVLAALGFARLLPEPI